MRKTLAKTTPLVKAVLLTRAIAVCVLLDSRVGLAITVNIARMYTDIRQLGNIGGLRGKLLIKEKWNINCTGVAFCCLYMTVSERT